MCCVWKPSFHHKKIFRIWNSLCLYLYSEAVSSYISGEKLINLRSRNPKVVQIRRMNSAMCLLVAAMSLPPDTTEPQIHLAENFRTKKYGEDYFYDYFGFSWILRWFLRTLSRFPNQIKTNLVSTSIQSGSRLFCFLANMQKCFFFMIQFYFLNIFLLVLGSPWRISMLHKRPPAL